MPDEMVAGVRDDPRMRALAPTMPYDFEVMGDFTGGGIPGRSRRGHRGQDALVLAAGGAGFLPRGRGSDRRAAAAAESSRILDGHDHGAPAEVVAPVVATFLTS